MAAIWRVLVLTAALAGGIAGSQAPEFAQQYGQRLGGALGELEKVVAAFDADAAAHGLTRQEALATYAGSAEPFLRARGLSLAVTLARHDRLKEAEARFASTSELARPVLLVESRDGPVLDGTWAAFRPAVPFTFAGMVWFAVGACTVALALVLPARLLRRATGRTRPSDT